MARDNFLTSLCGSHLTYNMEVGENIQDHENMLILRATQKVGMCWEFIDYLVSTEISQMTESVFTHKEVEQSWWVLNLSNHGTQQSTWKGFCSVLLKAKILCKMYEVCTLFAATLIHER